MTGVIGELEKGFPQERGMRQPLLERHNVLPKFGSPTALHPVFLDIFCFTPFLEKGHRWRLVAARGTEQTRNLPYPKAREENIMVSDIKDPLVLGGGQYKWNACFESQEHSASLHLMWTTQGMPCLSPPPQD